MPNTPLKALPGGSARTRYLEGLRAEQAWTYQRIADEIREKFSVRRTAEAVRSVMQGRADGLKSWRGEPPLLLLVGKALGADPSIIDQYHRMDEYQRGLPIDWTSIGYWKQIMDTLLKQNRLAVEPRENAAHRVPRAMQAS